MESQRRALENMSQDLLVKLDKMVEEQEKRAHDFAERTHSLSALPQNTELPPIPQVEAAPLPEVPKIEIPQPAAPNVPKKEAKIALEVPPLVTHKQSQPKPPASHPTTTPVRRPVRQAEKKEEGSIGVSTLLIIGMIIFSILRACS